MNSAYLRQVVDVDFLIVSTTVQKVACVVETEALHVSRMGVSRKYRLPCYQVPEPDFTIPGAACHVRYVFIRFGEYVDPVAVA